MKCAHCGKELTTFNVVDEDDNPLCDDCYYKYYESCNNCHRAIPKGTGLCSACSDSVFRKVINNYSTKVGNRFGNKSDNTKCLNDRYYGLEMEYNYFNPNVARVLFKEQYNDKLIYNKSDSSISSGVEIVTIPLVKSRVLKLIDDMDITRVKSNSRSNSVESGAGLHIHISRNTISPIAVHRLSILFNSNWGAPYKKYIYYLVGRCKDLDRYSDNQDHYYRMGSTTLLRSVDDTSVNSHGVALNLGNTHTVEFRLFKATTNPVQLKSYIEFADKAIEFAETQPLKLMTIPNFITYLSLSVTNPWLRTKLEKIKTSAPELFGVKEKEFTFDYYLSKFSDMNNKEIYDAIKSINSNVHGSKINWDVEKINNSIINTWCSESCGYNIVGNKLLESLLDEIKRRTVEEILAK